MSFLWHVIKVAPQREFYVRDEMHDAGMPALVPVRFASRKVRMEPGGIKWVRKAVMPGYVVACFRGPEDWQAVRSIRGYHGVIYVDDKPYRISNDAIPAIAALSVPALALQRDRSIKKGDEIKVKRGAFAELRGIIEDIKKGKVVAVVEMFGKPNRVVLDYEQLHPGA